MPVPKVESKIFSGVVLDFETGGLDPLRCACTQIAMKAVRFDTWEITESYMSYISPYYRQEIGADKRKVLKTKSDIAQAAGVLMDYEKIALDYSGITMDVLYRQGRDFREVAGEVIRLAERAAITKGAQCKPVLIGQNIPFDIGFLQQLIFYAGLEKEFAKVFAGKTDIWGNFQPHYIDTIDLAHLVFAADPSVTSYKLELIAERLNVELDDAHDADADVTATLDIVKVCSDRMRNNESGTGASGPKQKSRTHFKI